MSVTGVIKLMHGALHGDDFEAANAALRQICGAYRLSCDRWWEFRGSITTHRIGNLDVADVSVSPCSVVRDQRDTHYLGDHFFLVFQSQGTARMRQRGAEAVLGPGDSTIIDSRYPSVFQAPAGFRQFSFHLPTEPFREGLGKRPVPVAQTIRAERGAGRLLSDMLQSFVRNAPLLHGVELTGMTLQLLSAALGLPTLAESALDLKHRCVDLGEVVQYIEAHIGQADLTPQSISAHLNISVRQLYRVVAAHGCTPAALIWRKRLEHAHRLLGTCGARVPIIEIALSCGFKDGAHFSRAYRKMFGRPPRLSRNVGTFAAELASDDVSAENVILLS
jgi:AraC family transcriptional regulator, positive regulator of tynA and feaB